MMRRIINGKAYDTETGELVVERGNGDEVEVLYRTRNGAYFLWEQYLIPDGYGFYDAAHKIIPFEDEQAKRWLEANANEFVEEYFGEMPEGGAAERRLTLRLPNNLARRLETLAAAKGISMNRHIVACLERCAAQDGQPVVPA
jgi:predicted HicB family RNase H-like nuclease